jgi:DNA polymerase III delta subunit
VRFDFEGEEKKRLERVRQVLCERDGSRGAAAFTPSTMRAQRRRDLAKRAGLAIDRAHARSLVEASSAPMSHESRVEIEKLRLYSGGQRTITADDIGTLVPDARATTIFALVNALGRAIAGDRCNIFDTLTRDGEYLASRSGVPIDAVPHWR